MDSSETYMDVKFTQPYPRSPSLETLTSPYSELNIVKGGTLIDKDVDPPVASGHGDLPITAQTGEQKQKPKENIGNRPDRKTCLLYLVISILFVIVAGLSIHERTCSENWVTNKDRCYYVSTFETSFPRAMQECSNHDSRLLEINSRDEAAFVSHNLVSRNRTYWIGKCEDGNVSIDLLYNVSFEATACRKCDPYGSSFPCNRDQRFICEKPAPLIPDVPEKIQSLCQQTVEST